MPTPKGMMLAVTFVLGNFAIAIVFTAWMFAVAFPVFFLSDPLLAALGITGQLREVIQLALAMVGLVGSLFLLRWMRNVAGKRKRG
jgi:hypothetical protein